MESILTKEDTSNLSKDIEIKNINGVPYFCVPMNDSIDGSRALPQFDLNTDYEEECRHLRSCNESIATKIEGIDKEIQEIKEKIAEFEKNKTFKTKKYRINKKRDRRKSNQISRMFTCEICEKSYG